MATWALIFSFCAQGHFYSAQANSWGRVLIRLGFFCFLVGVANRHSCDVDWSQIDNLRRWLVRACCILITCSCEERLFGWPGRSVPPHVDSDKFRNELHSKEQNSSCLRLKPSHILSPWYTYIECIIMYYHVCIYNFFIFLDGCTALG